MIEQVPMPQLNELSKPLQQLLNKTSEKNYHQEICTTIVK